MSDVFAENLTVVTCYSLLKQRLWASFFFAKLIKCVGYVVILQSHFLSSSKAALLGYDEDTISKLSMKYYFAPVQGHTDAAYRYFHARNYGGEAVYTTPFIRLEKGELRKKDYKDALSVLNGEIDVVPQVIFKNGEELRTLVALLADEGLQRVDLNMGCPFPLQTSRGRGAASIASADCIESVRDVVVNNPEIGFSVKMRLGFQEQEWKPLLEVLNELRLDHIAVHPRLAKDQYGGSVDMDAFREIYESSKNSVVYNGDLLTPEDIARVSEEFPELGGIMVGRGVLGRPSLIAEAISGEAMPHDERIRRMLRFHKELMEHYRETLVGGDHQVLAKIQPFWEYSESEIGRKAWKAIRKASSIAKYQTALALIER